MDIEIPDSLKGEVMNNIKILQMNGLEISPESLFLIMKLKRRLLIQYRRTKKGQKVLEKYRQLLIERVKPIGTMVPIDLIFVTLLVGLLSYVVARFAGSFADEAGKILARRLLENEKKSSRQPHLTIGEYRFVKNQAVILIQKNKVLDSLSRQLKRKRSMR